MVQGMTHPQLVALVLEQQQQIAQLRRDLDDLREITPISKSHGQGAIAPLPQDSLPQLWVGGESDRGIISLVGGPSWTFGRGEENQFSFDDHCMSRNHAIVQRMEPNEFYLIDLGSRNGSFINGQRVNVPVAIAHGDLLTLGQTNFKFSFPPPIDPLHPQALSTHSPFEVAGELGGMTIATDVIHVRRLISVLVIDIRNFTGLTRQLDEHLLSEVVGAWFNAAGIIIRRHGSWVDKYIGDAVMAVWIHGGHEVGRDEILRPLQALQSLQEMTSRLHHSFPLPFPLRIGAGLNTGYAMVGNTGSGDRPDYTALGDTVNAAFRLESSTKQFGVDLALGLTPFQHLQQHFGGNLPFHPQLVHLKGYETPMPAYTCNFTDLQQLLEA
jgi:adenylate cyclase